MTSPLSASEFLFAEELLLEASGGPNALYVRDQARGVFKAVHAGAVLAADDAGKLVSLLGAPQSFVNAPTEPAHLREENRRHITAALLIHACRTDDPELVRRLRQSAPSEVHRIDLRLPIPASCLLALFDGLGHEELAIRHAAMRMAGNIHRHTDITPVLDVIIGELASPKRGRGWRHVAPAAGASWALVAHSLETDDFDGLCARVAAAIDPSAPTQDALRTLAALYTVAEQFALVTGLVGRASTRAAVIGGIHDAVCAICGNLELARPVPNARYPFTEAITVAEGLATNAGHRKQVEDIRERHTRLRPRKPRRLPPAEDADECAGGGAGPDDDQGVEGASPGAQEAERRARGVVPLGFVFTRSDGGRRRRSTCTGTSWSSWRSTSCRQSVYTTCGTVRRRWHWRPGSISVFPGELQLAVVEREAADEHAGLGAGQPPASSHATSSTSRCCGSM